MIYNTFAIDINFLCCQISTNSVGQIIDLWHLLMPFGSDQHEMRDLHNFMQAQNATMSQ